MQRRGYFVLLVVVFVAFTIGLNLGMHGMLLFSDGPTRNNANKASDQSSYGSFNNRYQTITRIVPETRKKVKFPVIVQNNHPTNHTTDSIRRSSGTGSIPATKSKVVAKSSEISDSDIFASSLHAKLMRIDEAVSKNTVSASVSAASDSSSILDKKGLSAGNPDIPILLLTCNRPQLLEETLKSLLAVRGVRKQNVLISQDGAMAEISSIARKFSIKLIQNLSGIRLRGGAASDGAARIAQHYKFSLSAIFDQHIDAPAVVVVEDDLLFSPDFYEYLVATAPVLASDPTAFVVSAWSDNGFRSKVKDPLALRRTDYFPGLGWLLTRQLYKSELEPKWPHSHWDHWLRSDEISKHREIVYPQVPRTYHNGIKGTFMNLDTHNKYFRDIGYNVDAAVAWPSGRESGPSGAHYMYGHYTSYEYRIEQTVRICKHVSDVRELLKYQDEVLCVWIDISTNCERVPVAFEPVASFFGLWHEHRRGNHRGLHEFYWESNYILLLNVYRSPGSSRHASSSLTSEISPAGFLQSGSGQTYRHLMPTTPHFRPITEPRSFDKSLLLEVQRRKTSITPYKADLPGMSCSQVCGKAGKRCNVDKLRLMNTCQAVKDEFQCESCSQSNGAEQPAFVDMHAEPRFFPGTCLVNSNPRVTTCDAKHPATLRLCACE